MDVFSNKGLVQGGDLKIPINKIIVAGTEIKPVKCVCNIGVYLDNNMDMSDQVNKIVSLAWFHLRNISHIRKYITQDVTEIVVHAFKTSKLDRHNSVS